MATQTESRTINSFHHIDLRDHGLLNITVAEQSELSVTADAELLPRIKTTVDRDTLFLSVHRDWLERISSLLRATRERQITYNLTMATTDLKSLRTSGAATVQASTVETEAFDVSISGLANISINTLSTQQLQLKMAGRGEFRATGTADRQTIVINGSGTYHGRQLTGTHGDIRINGQGNATLNVIEKLNLTIAGAGTVNYLGTPAVSQSLTGAGKVQQMA